jgi:hypothetical protein
VSDERIKKLEAAVETIPELLLLVNDLLPGIGGLALQNYARVNEAPLNAIQALKECGIDFEWPE